MIKRILVLIFLFYHNSIDNKKYMNLLDFASESIVGLVYTAINNYYQ